MKQDDRRITLVLRNGSSPERQWEASHDAPNRLIFVGALTVLQYALRNALSEFNRDVERVVLDRAITAAQFLDLLAAIPVEFRGDVLMIRYDDTAFLSAAGRGGDRVLYSLKADDLRFYLETHRLTLAEGNVLAATMPSTPPSIFVAA
ncbi:MAG TPA: hypothetical protein VF698_18500 [Thermoanaerobaculia bacterium]|jgi:hypothetical protein